MLESVFPDKKKIGVAKVSGENILNFLEFYSKNAWDRSSSHLMFNSSFVQTSRSYL